jgi:hypothetical protein
VGQDVDAEEVVNVEERVEDAKVADAEEVVDADVKYF